MFLHENIRDHSFRFEMCAPMNWNYNASVGVKWWYECNSIVGKKLITRQSYFLVVP